MNAPNQFAKTLYELFKQLPLVPEDEIESIHSYGYAEDGRTFCLMLDLIGGGTLLIQAEPGKPLAVGLV
jgi:hypothetical protein